MSTGEISIGLLGGTGEEGRGLALRWARAGARVVIGSRAADRARETAEQLNKILGNDVISYGDNTRAAQSDFVLLSVPFQHAAATLETVLPQIRPGGTLIDATVPVSFDKGRVSYAEPPEGSASEHLRALLRADVRLVGAFKTIPAHSMETLDDELDCDDFVVGDNAEARARVIEAMRGISGLRPVDAGGLEGARVIERMTVLAIGINRRYKIKTARFRVVGL
ncbi:MAG TPA: NADPH-dependent F420 reductase [Blastocatellia bacterium]|nr:NADPH-dependent F420 reductase [Blastocatellia bacterium]